MSTATDRLTILQRRIAESRARIGSDERSVQLIAFSKTRPAGMIAQVAKIRQNAFDENYLQEALNKIDAAETQAGRVLEWHFIGPMQSKKTADIAARFGWVHSVERLKTAQRLSLQRQTTMTPLSVCLQVNVSGESSKSSCTPAEAASCAGPSPDCRGCACAA